MKLENSVVTSKHSDAQENFKLAMHLLTYVTPEGSDYTILDSHDPTLLQDIESTLAWMVQEWIWQMNSHTLGFQRLSNDTYGERAALPSSLGVVVPWPAGSK